MKHYHAMQLGLLSAIYAKQQTPGSFIFFVSIVAAIGYVSYSMILYYKETSSL
jgi:hypothetical protein